VSSDRTRVGAFHDALARWARRPPSRLA
jgi:hypothetical protein